MSRWLLLVDDDTDVREAFGDVLEVAGWQVAHACDGLEALGWLKANDPPAVILLDLKMPRCDGYEFRRLQLADAALRLIPTVAFTAGAIAIQGDARSLRGVHLVPKSIDVPELLALLEQVSRFVRRRAPA